MFFVKTISLIVLDEMQRCLSMHDTRPPPYQSINTPFKNIGRVVTRVVNEAFGWMRGNISFLSALVATFRRDGSDSSLVACRGVARG